MRKHSIKRQFAGIFIGLMAGTMLVYWFINNIFLEEYYVRSKTRIIQEAYETISQAANSDTYGTDDFTQELNNVCSVSNLTVCIMDSNSQTKYVSTNGGRELEAQLIGYIFGFEQPPTRVIEEGEDYIIVRQNDILAVVE